MFLRSGGRSAGGLTFSSDFAAPRVALALGLGGSACSLLGLGLRDQGGSGAAPLLAAGRARRRAQHVSALMSGVILKIGIYGCRALLRCLGTPPAVVGRDACSPLGALRGARRALRARQHDLKRLLAYTASRTSASSSGVGAGAGRPTRASPLGAARLAGCLLHVEPCLFKGLLFLGAGAARTPREPATWSDRGPRPADAGRRRCSCWARSPSAACRRSTASSASGCWCGGFLHAGKDGGLLRFATLGAAGLALVAGLAVACFLRIAGVAFIGSARDRTIAATSPTPAAMTLPMASLALACLAIGVAPAQVLRLIGRAVVVVLGSPMVAGGGLGSKSPAHSACSAPPSSL